MHYSLFLKLKMNTNLKLKLIQTYREVFNRRFIEHRSTCLSDVDQLAAIQLTVLLVNKKLNLQEQLSPVDIFSLQHKIISTKKTNYDVTSLHQGDTLFGMLSFKEIFQTYQTFISACNLIDQADVWIFLNEYVSTRENDHQIGEDHLEGNQIRDCKNVLHQIGNCEIVSPVVKSPRNPSITIRNKLHLVTCFDNDDVKIEVRKLHLRRVVLGYIQLLVNSRDEIALARVIDVPTRDISHDAFTDIRKLALLKSMPMFQIVSSFVRQLILGGKGYLPDEKHSLYKHREGLQEFMELMDKLQEALDAESDINSTIIQMLKILKIALVRVKTPVYSNNIVNIVFSELFKKVKYYFESQKFTKKEKTLQLRDFLDYTSCLWGNGVGINSSQLCGVLSTPQVNEEQFKRISTLATQFTTPEVTMETPKRKVGKRTYPTNLTIVQENSSCKESRTPLAISKYAEENNIVSPPLKLIRCHEVPTVNNELSPTTQNKTNGKENFKLTKQTNMTASNKTSKVTNKNVKKAQRKSKASKKLTLPCGQKKLTMFFK